MYTYVMRWDIRPENSAAYQDWARSAIARLLDIQGVLEFRAYRTILGNHQVAVMYDFKDMQSWTAWLDNENTQRILEEARPLITNIRMELFGPSPIVPDPIRPGR